MKKFINVLAVVLALVMCLGIVVACGGEDAAATGDETTPAGATTTKPKVTTPNVTTATVTTPVVTTTVDPEAGRNPESEVDVPATGTISTAAELHAVLTKGDPTANYNVTATELDMAGRKWTGLKDYSGTFDFGGCKIKNAASSLFVSVKNGTVKNLVLADSTYLYTNEMAKADTNAKTGVAGNIYYSPIIRYATDISVSNVVVESTVSITTFIWTDASYTAGIVGIAEGSNVCVDSCSFAGSIYTDSNKPYGVAGIIGEINNSDASLVNIEDPAASTAIVINCVNYGTIHDEGYNTDAKVGGIIGRLNSAAAVKCANYGKISSNDGGQCAGVVAYMGGTAAIDKCLNAGEVVGGTGFVGGVTGYSNGTSRYVTNSVNIGKVSAASTTSVAGIIGLSKNAEVVTNCYNLSTAIAAFIMNNADPSAPVDPANPNTFTHKDGKAMIVTNCGNLETVDAIYTAIEAAAPGVFVKDNGTLKLA